jgi:DNA (cytosine-5)-methyltransferase 1
VRYAEVCAGVHASGLAWPGWECAWVSEIEPFPCAVLAERYPGVPNLGDMLKITDEELAKHGPIDLLMGGTPCQSFSIAGLRKGLADPRGNLALAFLALAHRTHARWICWENVPGVLSATSHDAPDPCPPGGGVASDPRPDLEEADDGRLGSAVVVADKYDSDEVHAFACFLAGLRELGYGFAYGSLDAQYFHLAQRRERVFLVAHLGDWQAPAAVLLEPACLRGDPPPSREARQDIAGSLAARSSAGGGLGTDMECSGGGVLGKPEDDGIAKCLTAPRTGSGGGYRGDAETETLIATDTAHSLRAQSNASHRADSDTYVAHTLRGNGHDASEDGSGRGVPLVWPLQEVGKRESKEQHGAGIGIASSNEPMYTLQAGAQHGVAVTREATAFNWQSGGDCRIGGTVGRTGTSKANRSSPRDGNPCHPLAAQAHPPAIAFTQKDSGGDAGEELSPTLRAMEHDGSHANGGGQVAILAPALTAFNMDSRSPQSEEQQRAVAAVHEASAMVRRLTPTECERLQGFPDGYTLVTYRGKPAMDGPRYRAIGNSIAVPCLAWIGKRVEIVDAAISRGHEGNAAPGR